MSGVFGILAAASLIALIEVPTLLKKRKKKELWVFSLLLLLGIGISIAQSLHIHVPSPLDFIAYLYKPISEFLHSILT